MHKKIDFFILSFLPFYYSLFLKIRMQEYDNTINGPTLPSIIQYCKRVEIDIWQFGEWDRLWIFYESILTAVAVSLDPFYLQLHTAEV